MNSELLTEEEVREYIESELDYLNLDETMFNQYVKFIMKIDRFRKCNVKTKIYNVNGAVAFFEEKMIKERFSLYNRHPEKVHAKKCFFYRN